VLSRKVVLVMALALVAALYVLHQAGYGVRVRRKPCTYWTGTAKLTGENPPSECPWFGRAYIIIR
jgi:hypothetical protein